MDQVVRQRQRRQHDDDRRLFQKLLSSVRAAQPTDIKPIELIPVGHVFDAIDQRINAGGLPGLGGSIANLYAPDTFGNLHLNLLGRFVATTTFYATIFAKDPEGMVPPSADYPGLDPATVSELAIDRLECRHHDARHRSRNIARRF